MIEFILVWCILPSLICFLLFIQIRHMEPKETLPEFFKYISDNDELRFLYLLIILWPTFVTTILLIFSLLVIGYIIDKCNLPTINLSWLFTELKGNKMKLLILITIITIITITGCSEKFIHDYAQGRAMARNPVYAHHVLDERRKHSNFKFCMNQGYTGQLLFNCVESLTTD